jgi:cytochrome c-type biogenesis protein CcmE
MKSRHRRFAIIAGALAALGIAAALVLNALRSNLAFFYTPTQVAAGEAPQDRAFRVGGLVKSGSLAREGITARFVITDTVRDVTVSFAGILPDLFQEGKGAVAQGRLEHGQFMASEVLAKHDENYMPPEAKHALDAAHRGGTARKEAP